MKKRTYILAILGGVVIICISCLLSKILKYANYNDGISQNLPETFRVELPLDIDSANFFCVRAKINKQHDMDFIIDTAADNLMKSEDLKNLNATFWGKHPIPTHNARKEWSQKDLYYFDSFDIGSLSFGKLLFKEISKENDSHIYRILSSNNKNILGRNILELLNWKFSLDEKKLILFSSLDQDLLAKESADGYIKIDGGLKHKNSKLTFPQINQSDKFIFDLGFDGEIAVNKKIFEFLSEKVPYREVEGINGIVYIFDQVDIDWGGIIIKNCLVNYKPGNVSNLIGNRLMRRFNFILAYNVYSDNYIKDLYLKPVKNFHEIKAWPILSDFGFVVQQRDGNNFLAIEVNGLADKAGLKVGDQLQSIDSITMDFVRDSPLIKYLSDKQSITLQVIRDDQPMEFHLSLEA